MNFRLIISLVRSIGLLAVSIGLLPMLCGAAPMCAQSGLESSLPEAVLAPTHSDQGQPAPDEIGERRSGPNVIMILADDLGYGDLGCFGSALHRTPCLDALASAGIVFRDFYVASPICTPSRYALLTGKHPARLGEFGVLWPPTPGGMPPEEYTLAEWLRENGYATGIAGKWHLGHSDASLLPLNQGFDSWYGMPYPNDMGPFHPQRKNVPGVWPPMPMFRDHEMVQSPVDPNWLTQQYHAEAVRFVAENADRPFFLYVSHAMPHTLLGASSGFRGKSQNGLYGDAIEELDWSVGGIIKLLHRLEIAEKTLVIFTSDNGAVIPRANPDAMTANRRLPNEEVWRVAGSNAPFRDGKGSVYEGGVRVPAIAYWPGTIPPGGEIRTPVSIVDTFATIADLIGRPCPATALDSTSFAPLLRGEDIAAKPLFFGTGDVRAIRDGNWKLLLSDVPAWKQGFDRKPFLFDLSLDPSEAQNLLEKEPEVAARLLRKIEQYQSETTK